ncbi:hypothetical protein V9L20_07540 [Variovorax sp. CCNWLW225]|uniref:hypothetical protein n=1 Tax=Variovorax sp. CCNWLW225 TaxID=3127462 RepID=UPI0030782F13
MINAGFNGNTGNQAVKNQGGGWGVLADGAGTTFLNSQKGIINVAPGGGYSESFAAVLSNSATGLNQGTINLGVAPEGYRGIIDWGVKAESGATFVNDVGGTIFWGRTPQYTAGQATTPVATSTFGVVTYAGANADLENKGTIAIGAQAERVWGMLANLHSSAVRMVNSGTISGGGIKYFHANSTAPDSQAIGLDSVAIGPQAVAGKQNSLAAGMGATAQGTNSTAIGVGSVAMGQGDLYIGNGAGVGGQASSRDNSGFGSFAGQRVNGGVNIAAGARTGNDVTGSANSAFGAEAGNSVLGDSNSAVGYTAGQAVDGDSNAAFGTSAGSKVFGNRNIAIGNAAGQNVGTAAAPVDDTASSCPWARRMWRAMRSSCDRSSSTWRWSFFAISTGR